MQSSSNRGGQRPSYEHTGPNGARAQTTVPSVKDRIRVALTWVERTAGNMGEWACHWQRPTRAMKRHTPPPGAVAAVGTEVARGADGMAAHACLGAATDRGAAADSCCHDAGSVRSNGAGAIVVGGRGGGGGGAAACEVSPRIMEASAAARGDKAGAGAGERTWAGAGKGVLCVGKGLPNAGAGCVTNECGTDSLPGTPAAAGGVAAGGGV